MSNGQLSGQASNNGRGSHVLSGGDDDALSADTYTAQRLVSYPSLICFKLPATTSANNLLPSNMPPRSTFTPHPDASSSDQPQLVGWTAIANRGINPD